MKFFLYYAIVLGLFILSEAGYTQSIKAVTPSVAFFYGNNPPLGKLCQFDWVVVDPGAAISPQNYCLSVSTPLAYVSLGEVDQNTSFAHDIEKSWIIGRNKAWNNNFVMDQTQPGWQNFFLDKIITPLWKQGYRGFFFDTLDSYQLAIKDPALQQLQLKAMESVIREVRRRFPEAIIILNRGFNMLPVLAPDINAVVIESLYQGWSQAKQQYEKTNAIEQKMLWGEIDKIRQFNLPIIIIDYLPPNYKKETFETLKKQIQNQGFIPVITNNVLDQLYAEKKQDIVERRILVLYKNTEKIPTLYIPAIRYLGIIFEYLGYVPEYQEITDYCQNKKGTFFCPKDRRFAGIVTWIDTAEENNQFLLPWLKTQMDKGVPVVFLQGFGVPIDTPFLKKLGLMTTTIKPTDLNLRITQQNSNYVGHEIEPKTTPYDFFPMCAKSGEILLQLENSFHQTQDAIAIMPWGGYALNPYLIEYLPNLKAYWIINPFEFFTKALRLKVFPIPDTTTENGRRFLSVHIDGDGFTSPARWLNGQIAAIELRDRILKRFKIPTSVSVVTGEISPDGVNKDKSAYFMRIARSIFALPWVESASHSFSHPFLWDISEKGSDLATGEESYSVRIPGYQFNAHQEILGSVDFINQYLVNPDKPCRLFFWSGMANPSGPQVKLAYSGHLLNINGLNDTDINKNLRSLTSVRPLGLKRGDNYQIFAPIDMDFNYINKFSGPLYGFKRVIETWALTNQPRRLKPMDIYYHIYAASFPAMLNTLIDVYQWAMKQETMPIYISEYIQKVLDFYQVEISPFKKGWLIATQGALKEIRSPLEWGYPDLEQSDNVIGFNEFNHVRYIHLGPGPVALLRYREKAPTTPYLVDANAQVVKWVQQGRTYHFQFKGHVPVTFTLANTKTCQIKSSVILKEVSIAKNQQNFSSDKDSLEIYIDC